MTNESMKTASAPSTHQTPAAKQGALDDIGSKWSKFSKHDLSALGAVIAAELAQDGKWYNGRVVSVTDGHGNEIGRVPVVTAIEDYSR